MKRFAVLGGAFLGLVACGNTSTQSNDVDKQTTKYWEQAALADSQLKAMTEQQEKADEQLKRNEDLLRRNEEIATRWERIQERQERILSLMEKQQKSAVIPEYQGK